MGKVGQETWQRQGHHRTAFHVASVQVPLIWLHLGWLQFCTSSRFFFKNPRGLSEKGLGWNLCKVWDVHIPKKITCERWWILRPCLVRPHECTGCPHATRFWGGRSLLRRHGVVMPILRSNLWDPSYNICSEPFFSAIFIGCIVG